MIYERSREVLLIGVMVAQGHTYLYYIKLHRNTAVYQMDVYGDREAGGEPDAEGGARENVQMVDSRLACMHVHIGI